MSINLLDGSWKRLAGEASGKLRKITGDLMRILYGDESFERKSNEPASK
jgi:hypothetical protein